MSRTSRPHIRRIPWEEPREDRWPSQAASKVTATSGRASTALSPREWEVAWLVARGHTNRQIAAHLYLSEKTVERHLSRIFGKLEITARATLATYVTQQSAVIALRA